MELYLKMPIWEATQRKSLPKFNLRPLATTCRFVWPGLKTVMVISCITESVKNKKIWRVSIPTQVLLHFVYYKNSKICIINLKWLAKIAGSSSAHCTYSHEKNEKKKTTNAPLMTISFYELVADYISVPLLARDFRLVRTPLNLKRVHPFK